MDALMTEAEAQALAGEINAGTPFPVAYAEPTVHNYATGGWQVRVWSEGADEPATYFSRREHENWQRVGTGR